jgi:hypothetical protein
MKARSQNLFVALTLLVLLTVSSQFSAAFAQGTTAFTYQGQLKDSGTNANGTYTMIFNLYDSSGGGNLIGGPIVTTNTLANGLFTVNLDFGAGAFNGGARYLDITVTNGGVAQELSPRVEVLPSPYALYAAVAATVTNGAIMNAQLAASAVNANNIASGQVVKSLNGLMDAVSLSAGNNVTITPSGNTLQISATGGGGGVVVTNELAAGNNVGLFTNNGVVQISSFVPNMQFFRNVTNATFTVPTNVTRIEVEMWGAGGGGGGGDSNGYEGGGGGSGAYAINVFTNLTPGTSYLVTAGAGGNGGGPDASGSSGATSSFGTLMTATGGSGGQGATSSAAGSGGAAGTETGAIFYPSNVGSNGGQGGAPGINNSQGGWGGGVWRGSPGENPFGGGGSGPGGGGAGGGPAPSPGGSGGSGLVFVYY